mgnify:CR=1 FL=1
MSVLSVSLIGLLAALALSSALNAAGGRLSRIAVGLVPWLMGAIGLTSVAGLATDSPNWHILALASDGHAHALSLGLRLDLLGLGMTAFIAGIGLVVYRYATRYLLGDQRREGFLAALGVVVVVAMLQALSPGILQFALGWIAASFGLQRLIGHADTRPAARAVRAKFLTSRLGDAAMVVAIIALLVGPGTTDFTELATAVRGGDHHFSLLIAGCAMVWTILCKTALVPAQYWLISTVEAPTPLSALMHAGVVNAGGLLAILLSPVFAAAPEALDLLLAVGLVSAVVGPLVMWAQTDLKRSLAWSTVGQMGFMAVQCGLGAFGAAFLHLLGHGCYKADAFLRSGTLGRAAETRPDPAPLASSVGRWLLGIGLAAATLMITYQLCATDPRSMPGGWALLAIQAIAMGQLLGTPTAAGISLPIRLGFLVAGTAFYGALTVGVEHLLTSSITHIPTDRGPIGLGLMILAPLALAGLGLFWVVLPAIARHPSVIAWRIHAGQGFYLSQLTERLIGFGRRQQQRQQQHVTIIAKEMSS